MRKYLQLILFCLCVPALQELQAQNLTQHNVISPADMKFNSFTSSMSDAHTMLLIPEREPSPAAISSETQTAKKYLKFISVVEEIVAVGPQVPSNLAPGPFIKQITIEVNPNLDHFYIGTERDVKVTFQAGFGKISESGSIGCDLYLNDKKVKQLTKKVTLTELSGKNNSTFEFQCRIEGYQAEGDQTANGTIEARIKVKGRECKNPGPSGSCTTTSPKTVTGQASVSLQVFYPFEIPRLEPLIPNSAVTHGACYQQLLLTKYHSPKSGEVSVARFYVPSECDRTKIAIGKAPAPENPSDNELVSGKVTHAATCHIGSPASFNTNWEIIGHKVYTRTNPVYKLNDVIHPTESLTCNALNPCTEPDPGCANCGDLIAANKYDKNRPVKQSNKTLFLFTPNLDLPQSAIDGARVIVTNEMSGLKDTTYSAIDGSFMIQDTLAPLMSFNITKEPFYSPFNLDSITVDVLDSNYADTLTLIRKDGPIFLGSILDVMNDSLIADIYVKHGTNWVSVGSEKGSFEVSGHELELFGYPNAEFLFVVDPPFNRHYVQDSLTFTVGTGSDTVSLGNIVFVEKPRSLLDSIGFTGKFLRAYDSTTIVPMSGLYITICDSFCGTVMRTFVTDSTGFFTGMVPNGLWRVNISNASLFIDFGRSSDSVNLGEIVAPLTQISVEVSTRWNMVSVPLEVDDFLTTHLFPSAVSHAYGYHDGYQVKDTLGNGVGYWMRFNAAEAIPLVGFPLQEDSVAVSQGWNMIGSISSPIVVSGIVAGTGTSILSDFYGYQNGYYVADTIQPGKGYWVRTSESGFLIFSSLAPLDMRYAEPFHAIKQVFVKLNSIDLTDASGSTRTLYFGSQPSKGFGPSEWSFELPPLPPVGIFDARFSSQQMVETYSEKLDKPQEYRINVSSTSYPLTITWGLVKDVKEKFILTDAQDGKALGSIVLNEKGSIKITDSKITTLVLRVQGGKQLPTEFALRQSYPNPFNPTTVIEFDVPQNALVTLKVYDIVGREVTTLDENKQYEAGTHQVQFDASSFASGVYFYRIEATSVSKANTSFSQVKKMLLIR